MHESIAHIAEQLKQARLAKGLSQRALSVKAGIPQSHISKIESGAVNLQLSSLIELSRVLGLELMLVPQKAAPAAKSVVRSAFAFSPLKEKTLLKQAENKTLQTPPAEYALRQIHEISSKIDSDKDTLENIRTFTTPAHLKKLNEAYQNYQKSTDLQSAEGPNNSQRKYQFEEED